MTSLATLIQRGRWRIRHTASSCISTIGRGIDAVESATAEKRGRLVIIDELFPSLFTGFVIGEFNAILEAFPNAVVYSTIPTVKEFYRYGNAYPKLAKRAKHYFPSLTLRGAAAYVMFLNNIFNYLPKIEECGLPFAFELYPGGGLQLDGPEADIKLSRVFSSPLFRKVIVTQTITRDYLLRKNYCRADQIEFIFGVVVPPEMFASVGAAKRRYGMGKNTLDICFVAKKYLPGGVDKGYDRFLLAARSLSTELPQVRFHVVGGFTEADGDVSGLHDRIRFYGQRPTPFFPQFHASMDIILSPNVHSAFGPGYFDGFPTGSCVEAALCGTAIFATDDLRLNEGFLKEGEEIVTISRDPHEIVCRLREYAADPCRLASLGERGRDAVRRLYSFDAQMGPRLRVLGDLTSEERNDAVAARLCPKDVRMNAD